MLCNMIIRKVCFTILNNPLSPLKPLNKMSAQFIPPNYFNRSNLLPTSDIFFVSLYTNLVSNFRLCGVTKDIITFVKKVYIKNCSLLFL